MTKPLGQDGRYRHHKYTWAMPFGSVYHRWELVGLNGAIHFTANISDRYSTSCGLEFHHLSPLRPNEAPHHLDCPLTGGRCWHDGTSMYATDTLWPMISAMLKSGAHEEIFRLLESEADEHFRL